MGEGLGTDNFFGTDPAAMAEVLRGAKKAGIEFGFIFFEACDTNVNNNEMLSKVIDSELENIGAYYSAEGALWYRNIDWHILMFWSHAAKGDPAKNLSKEL